MQKNVGEHFLTPKPVTRQIDSGREYILYDETLLTAPDYNFFSPEHWKKRNAIACEAPGRGTVCVFHHEGLDLALRHYSRGGWISRLNRDRYLWTGLESTRAWREWHLLSTLHEQGLPVPRPVAGRVLRQGPFYSADLVTEYLKDTSTLADLLMLQPLTETVWRRIGAVVRQFHEKGVFHSDLNARNILLDTNYVVFLIDFDKCRQGHLNADQRNRNLERLQRSLQKLKKSNDPFHFNTIAWHWLCQGYQENP